MEEDQFRNKISKYVLLYFALLHVLIVSRQFFSGPLKQFEKTKTWKSITGKKMTGLVNVDVIDAIGEGTFLGLALDLH